MGKNSDLLITRSDDERLDVWLPNESLPDWTPDWKIAVGDTRCLIASLCAAIYRAEAADKAFNRITLLSVEDLSRMENAVDRTDAAEERLKGYEAEKFRRMYYQGIVYAVCLWIDSIEGNAPGHGVVCGTYETPSEGVEEALERIGSKLKFLRLIKGINDFTEEEEKELDTLRSKRGE